MKITREIIEKLYLQTCDYKNGLDMELIFKNGYHSNEKTSSDSYSLAYDLINGMQYSNPELGFGVIGLHADGGIRDYMITYQYDEYLIMISREQYLGRCTKFKSVEHFIDWLNKHVHTIRKKEVRLLADYIFDKMHVPEPEQMGSCMEKADREADIFSKANHTV